jgi:hypothetical protein
MDITRTYIPNNLEWSENGYPCYPKVINRMCRDILRHGKIAEIHHHTATSISPDGTTGKLDMGTQVLTVECEHVPHIIYVIHLSGFRVLRIIETVTGASRAGLKKDE